MAMPLVPALLLVIMIMSSALIVWLVAREVAKRVVTPSPNGRDKRALLEAN